MAKHYIITPSLNGEVSADTQNIASTTVYCPLRMIHSHSGYDSAQNDTRFKEIVGVVPTGIEDYYTGALTNFSQASLSTYIEKIQYDYLANGHKAISIVYNPSQIFFLPGNLIRFNILFHDGSFHEVKQIIVRANRLSDTRGAVLSQESYFTSEGTTSFEVSPPSSSGLNPTCNLEILGGGIGTSKLHFNTYAQTNFKYQSDGDMIPSAGNDDYAQLIYLNFAFPGTTTTGYNAGNNLKIKTTKPFWRFRQTSRYDLSNVTQANGIRSSAKGSIGSNVIDILSELSLMSGGSEIDPLAVPHKSGFQTLEFLHEQTPNLLTADGTYLGADGFASNQNDEVYLQKNDTNDTLLARNLGFLGDMLPMDQLTQANSYIGAVNYSGPERTHAQRFDGAIYTLSKSNQSNFSSTYYSSSQDDTSNRDLDLVAKTLVKACGIMGVNPGNVGVVDPFVDSIYSHITGQNNTMEALLDLNMVKATDVISNCLLGRHSYYLSRPHQAADVNVEQGKLQATAAHVAFGGSQNYPGFLTTLVNSQVTNDASLEGILINGAAQNGTSSYYLQAIPYHYYIDSYLPYLAYETQAAQRGKTVEEFNADGQIIDVSVKFEFGTSGYSDEVRHITGGQQLLTFENLAKVVHPIPESTAFTVDVFGGGIDSNGLTRQNVICGYGLPHFGVDRENTSIGPAISRRLVSIDRNAVIWSGAGSIPEAVVSGGSTTTDSLAMHAFTVGRDSRVLMSSMNITHRQSYALFDNLYKTSLTNTVVLGNDHSNKRGAYVRGCLSFIRDLDLNASKYSYRVELLTNPVLTTSAAGSETVQEFRFSALYNVGGDHTVPDQVVSTELFNLEENSPVWGFTGISPYDCGCGEDVDNIQFKTTGGEFTSSNYADIWRAKYTPGKHSLDPALFPVNSNEWSSGSAVTDEGNDDVKLTLQLSGDQPLEFDRLLVDVDVEDFVWQTDKVFVSKVEIGGRSDAVTQAGTMSSAENPVGDDLQEIPQVFEFVSIGTIVNTEQGGGVIETVSGCTDDSAINYDSEANVDNGTCLFCLQTSNPGTDFPDGSVVFDQTIGGSMGLNNLSVGPLGGVDGSVFNTYADYLNASWSLSGANRGNAFNHWGPGLDAAIPAEGGFPVVPYGNGFDGALAAPYTEYKMEFNTALMVSSTPGTMGYIINQVLLNGGIFKLHWFDIEAWTELGAVPLWNRGYPTSHAGTFYEHPPISIGGDSFTDTLANHSLGTMVNQGDNTNVVFASYNVTDNPNGFAPNVTDPLLDGFGQTYLQPGKHYIALIELDFAGAQWEDPRTGNPIVAADCGYTNYYFPTNTWVRFCACDLAIAENFSGDLFDYPWGDNVDAGISAFPAGYTSLPACAPSGARVASQTGDDQNGYCEIFEPIDCTVSFDACVTGAQGQCNPAPTEENPANQDMTGYINVNVFGQYTGQEDDEYQIQTGGVLFTFEIYVISGVWSEGEALPPTTDPSVVVYESFNTVSDYLNVGYDVNLQSNAVVLNYNDIPAGQYTVVINPTSFNPEFQDTVCAPRVVTDGSVQVSVNGETQCPDLATGCTDPSAGNYDPAAIVDNGTCEYADCEEFFVSGEIDTVTTTNTTIDCVVLTEEDGSTYNGFQDDASGSITVTYDATIPENNVSGTFCLAYAYVYEGAAGSAINTIMTAYGVDTEGDNNIMDTTRTDTIFITDDVTGANIGGFLGFEQDGTPLLEITDLAQGYYCLILIPSFALVTEEEEYCSNVLIEYYDEIDFATVGATYNFDDCPAPCNDQTNPDLCPDQVGGCTDPNASNYDPDATYDVGNCNYAGQEACIEFPEDPACLDCATAALSNLPTLRNCDEFNETVEGCGDPSACNFNPNADVFVQSRCEYCCDGEEDCVEVGDGDNCEDDLGNILPDCIQPECPDPNNPDCNTTIIDPCPAGECLGPPDPACVLLNNCPQGPTNEGPDTTVTFEDPVVQEVTCTPDFYGVEFQQVQMQAMTCSANEGSKLFFKLRAGIEHDRTDLIKLELINYLFNNAMGNSCMSDCDVVDDTGARALGINKLSVKERWRRGGRQKWAASSTYSKGDIVAVERLENGIRKRRYYMAVSNVGAGSPMPGQSQQGGVSWELAIDVRGKTATGVHSGAQYVFKLYEFMNKFCQNCSIVNTPADTIYDPTADIPEDGGGIDKSGTGLIDENGNVINLF